MSATGYTPRKYHRDNESGRFVTEEYAKAYPHQTSDAKVSDAGAVRMLNEYAAIRDAIDFNVELKAAISEVGNFADLIISGRLHVSPA